MTVLTMAATRKARARVAVSIALRWCHSNAAQASVTSHCVTAGDGPLAKGHSQGNISDREINP